MAEIVQQPQGSGGDIGGAWDAMVYVISNYWWVLLLFCVVIGLIVAVFMIWKAKEENDRRRDSSVYATAMNLWESCEINANNNWIRNRYSLLNLFFLGIPFIRREHSVKIVDIDHNTIGWYRGFCKTQEGDSVYLMYKTKSLLGLKEDKFLLYCPLNVRIPKYEINSSGEKIIVYDERGKPDFDLKPLPKNMVVYDKNSNEIVIRCNTVTRQGSYYRFPNYVIIDPDGHKHHLDMTYDLSNFIAKTNFMVLAENTFSDMSRALGRGIEINPALRYEQKSPDKEKYIEEEQNL